MIQVRLTFTGKDAGLVARSLQPDNLPEMSMSADQDVLELKFTAEKIGTILSTADDILMNIKIAEEALTSSEAL